MPASNVTFVANWIEASQAINYKVNDAAMAYCNSVLSASDERNKHIVRIAGVFSNA